MWYLSTVSSFGLLILGIGKGSPTIEKKKQASELHPTSNYPSLRSSHILRQSIWDPPRLLFFPLLQPHSVPYSFSKYVILHMLKTVRSEKMYMNDDALVAAVELSHKVYGHSSYLFSCPLHPPSVIPTGIPIAHPSCVSSSLRLDV